MNHYTAYLKHDNGKCKLTVSANNLIEAKCKVMELEKCPERSIEFIGRTPTTKSIKKTKSLLRGL